MKSRLLTLVTLLAIVLLTTATAVTGALGLWRAAIVTLAATVLAVAVFLYLQGRRNAHAHRMLATRLDASSASLRVIQRRTDEALNVTKELQRRLDPITGGANALEISERIQRATDILESAEHRIVAILEQQRSVADIREETAKKRVIQLKEAAARAEKLIRTSKIDTVSEIEALLQILPEVDRKALLPATGSWAIDARSLAHILEVVRQNQPARVLELGSGTSTIWLGYIVQKYGGEMISVDHDEHYMSATRANVAKHHLNETLKIIHAPLVAGSWPLGADSWYQTDKLAAISGIDMLLIDGPPKDSGTLARLPALYELYNALNPEALIILDDSQRPEETQILEKWMSDFPLEKLAEGSQRLTMLRKLPADPALRERTEQ